MARLIWRQDGAEGLAYLDGNSLHIIRGELTGKGIEYDCTCGCTVGVGSRNPFRALFVQYIEDVVVVVTQCADDSNRGLKILIGALYRVCESACVHHSKSGEDHCDAEEAPGETMGTCGA